MHARLVSRFLFPIVALALVAGLTSCRTSGKSQKAMTAEEATSALLVELIPDGLVLSNNLGAGGAFDLRNAHLFDSEILVEDNEGRVTSLDRLNLSPKWYFTGLPSTTEFAPVVSAISAIFISKGVLFEVDRRYGNQLHAFALDFVPSASPVAAESSVYVPALASAQGNRTLLSVNLVTGVEGWGLATRGSVSSAPAIGGSSTRPMIYLATDRGGIFAIPAETAGKGAPDPSWSKSARGRVVSAPVLSDDLLLVGSEMGELWALDRITGTPAWVHYSGEPIVESAWAGGDQVYFLNSDGFHALSRENGTAAWTLPRQVRFIARRGGTVYVLDPAERSAHAIDTASGEVLRSVVMGSNATFVANPYDHVVYLVTKAGLVFAVDKRLF